jgi:murein DD-endopeptidase MepM/ murein hydrolase activator NlpD
MRRAIRSTGLGPIARLLILLGVLLASSLWLGEGAVLAQDSGTYTVVPGDTLGAIASRLGVTLDALVTVNGIADPNQVAVGQVLIIPGTGGPAHFNVAGANRVRALPGDTIAAVAARYGQDAALLATLNNLSAASRLFPGEPVNVPAEVAPGPDLHFGAITAVSADDTLVQGYTGRVYVTTNRPLPLSGLWLGQPLVFTPISADGLQQFAFLPVPALQEAGVYDLVLSYTTLRGAPVSRTWSIAVEEGDYESQEIVVSDDKAAEMTPDAIQAEKDKIIGLWSQVSPTLLWQEPFLRPIDAQYQTSSPFGTRRAYSIADIGNFHAGQDFAAPEGVLITAPAAGVVVLAEKMTVRGNAVLIDHGRGVFTGYWHLSEIRVQPGQGVAPGDILGVSGNTGLSTGAHLHWEMRINGVAVTPLQFLDEPSYAPPAVIPAAPADTPTEVPLAAP